MRIFLGILSKKLKLQVPPPQSGGGAKSEEILSAPPQTGGEHKGEHFQCQGGAGGSTPPHPVELDIEPY